ncbi:hypothetical protein F6Y02_37425 (plasmid) [Bacillus megaterium]|nr:hypothetical protein [Priestia megaterium]
MSKEVEKLGSIEKKLDELDGSPGEKAKRLVSKKLVKIMKNGNVKPNMDVKT